MDDKARLVTLPKKSYQLRVLESETGVSQIRTGDDGTQTGGNPQHTLTLEIINAPPIPFKNPETGEMDVADVNGTQVKRWVTLTKKAISFVNETRKALGMDPLTEEQLAEDQGGVYVGKTGYAILEGKQVPIMEGDGKTPIINPHTGKPVTRQEIKFGQWLSPT